MENLKSLINRKPQFIIIPKYLEHTFIKPANDINKQYEKVKFYT